MLCFMPYTLFSIILPRIANQTMMDVVWVFIGSMASLFIYDGVS